MPVTESVLRWEVIEDRHALGEWRVEAFDYTSGGEGPIDGDGRQYVAIFTGDDAQLRAEEYCIWKQKDHPTT